MYKICDKDKEKGLIRQASSLYFYHNACVWDINGKCPIRALTIQRKGKASYRGRKNDEQQNGDELQTRKRGEKADDSQGTVSFRLV